MPHPRQLNKNRIYPDIHPRVAAAFVVPFNEDLTAISAAHRIPQTDSEHKCIKFNGGCTETEDCVWPDHTKNQQHADDITLGNTARREYAAETAFDASTCFTLFDRIDLTHRVGKDRKTKGYFLAILRSSATPSAERIEASEMKPPVWIPIANLLRGEHDGVKFIPQHQEAGIIALAHLMRLLTESIDADPDCTNSITSKFRERRDALSMEIAFALGSRGLESLEDYAALIAAEAKQGIR
jgi:hypothetical protein